MLFGYFDLSLFFLSGFLFGFLHYYYFMTKIRLLFISLIAYAFNNESLTNKKARCEGSDKKKHL